MEDNDDDRDEEVVKVELPPECSGPAIFSCLLTFLECPAEVNESCFLPLEETWFIMPTPVSQHRGHCSEDQDQLSWRASSLTIQLVCVSHARLLPISWRGGLRPKDVPRYGSSRTRKRRRGGSYGHSRPALSLLHYSSLCCSSGFSGTSQKLLPFPVDQRILQETEPQSPSLPKFYQGVPLEA